MTEWNPTDPDATSVYYDLSSWSIDQRAELAAEMADAEIPHAWNDTELMVPEEFEQAVRSPDRGRRDTPRHRVGQRTSTPQRRWRRVSPPTQVPAPSRSRCADDAATTEYELDEWPERDRSALTHALDRRRHPVPLGGDRQLLVGTEDEEVVDALLDEIETGEYVDVDAEPMRRPTVTAATISCRSRR